MKRTLWAGARPTVSATALVLGLFACHALVSCFPIRAQEPSAAASQAPARGRGETLLHEGQRLLSRLRFDAAVKVLTQALEALGEEPGDEAAVPLRSRAYDLRAQALLSLGKGAKADADFEALVRTDPAYALDEKRVSPKIVRRFRKVRERLVGSLTVTCDPGDAVLVLDGKPVGPCPLLDHAVLAGEHSLAGSHQAFDLAEMSVSIAPGEKTQVQLALEANSRSLAVRTIPSGVEAALDDQIVGVTEPGESGPAGVSAPLLIPAVSPGEHLLRFRKSCMVEQLRQVNLVVDLLDRSVVELEPIELPPAAAKMSVASDPAGAEVAIDGATAGRAPLADVPVCAGRRELEVRFGEAGRWREVLDVSPGQKIEIQARPRPDLAYSVRTISAAARDSDEEEEAALLRLRAVLTELTNYNSIELPEASENTSMESDGMAPARGSLSLAAEVLGKQAAAKLRLSLLSPFHGEAETWEYALSDETAWKSFLQRLNDPAGFEEPATGLVLIDTRLTEGPVVLSVRSGSPAATAGFLPGDEILLVGSAKPANAAGLRDLLNETVTSGAVSVQVRRGASKRQLSVSSALWPILIPYGPSPATPARQAARSPLSYHKAAVDFAFAARLSTREPVRSLAFANLAAALLHFNENAPALTEALSLARLPEGAGISRGTTSYLAGIAYERLGSYPEAIAAFEAAARSPEATLTSLDGPPLAPEAAARAGRLKGAASAR